MTGRRTTVRFLAAALLAGCQADSSSPESCEYETRPLGFDEQVSNMVLGEIVEKLASGTSGDLSWYGSSEQVSCVNFDAGLTTTFNVRADVVGEPRFHEPIDPSPKGRGFCPTTAELDLIVHFSTEDGGFAEVWETTGEIADGAGPVVSIWVRGISGFAGALTVEPKPEFLEEYAERDLLFLTAFNPIDPPLAWGELYYWGETEPSSDGETMEQEGIKHTIAEWLPPS